MNLSQSKLLVVLCLTLALSVGTASADSNKAFKWSDHAFTSPRTGSAYPAPQYYNYAPAGSPAVVAASPAQPQATVAVRGPDGVVRYYPVAGGAVVQRETGLPGQAVRMVTIRGADGVLRTYPVVTPTAPVQGTAAPQPTVVVPSNPCR